MHCINLGGVLLRYTPYLVTKSNVEVLLKTSADSYPKQLRGVARDDRFRFLHDLLWWTFDQHGNVRLAKVYRQRISVLKL